MKSSMKWGRRADFSAKLLKKFELLRARVDFFLNSSVKVEDVAILFAGDVQYAHLSFGWHKSLNTFYVHLHIFVGGAMADIDRELHHHETIFFERGAKLCGTFALHLGQHGQIKKYENPHNMVSIYTIVAHLVGIIGKSSCFCSLA